MARALLGDRDADGVGAYILEHALVDQPVMDDDIGGLQRFHRANGQQRRIARTCADKDDAPARGRIE